MSTKKKEEVSMTRTQLEDRIKLLEQERENLKMTFPAYDGAIQDCKYWLAELDKAETKTETKQSTKVDQKDK